jgi:hypothetical protein
MHSSRTLGRLAILAAAVSGAFFSEKIAVGANLSILLPLHRVAYQTNEWIDVSVVRGDSAALAAGNLTLTLTGDDASKMAFTFPITAVAVEHDSARQTEHLHLNGRLIRPGKYTIEVGADGATASAPIEIYSHLRRSNFKLIDWGSSTNGKDQVTIGEDGMGFNLIYYTRLSPDDIIRGGADFMRNCTMSGGHQMDLRQECDWSDPYVLQGAEARVVNEALQSRTMPNCVGVHFYDEPGLSWWKDPKNDNLMVPFNLPSQDRTYKGAFGNDPPHWSDVKVDDVAAVAKWDHLNRWKESFMDAAWKYSQFGVSQVRPDLLSVTQSQYGWMAYGDGYYFNVVRSLPAISGHGGYDDGPATFFQPSFFHEMGRARDVNKPVWYMPTWYGETSDQFRLEQYLSFMTNLQGMAKPPTMQTQHPEKGVESSGVVESNKLMARLGTIFTTMRPTRPEVAMLYSLSQDLGAEVRDMQDPKKVGAAAYEGGDHVRAKMLATYMAGKMIHTPFWPIVEEDVVDGSLAANHKAVVISGINFLDPKVTAALEAYAAAGGLVIVTDDSQVQIKGATKLGVETPTNLYHQINSLWATNQHESERLRRAEYWYAEFEAYAHALQSKLSTVGIKPALDSDSEKIITQRQAQSDIEYLFAVNATPKADDPKVRIEGASATLSVVDDGRPIYDAVHGGVEPGFLAQGKTLAGKFAFGPGAMRVFARTVRPIGGVDVQTPLVFRDFTVPADPIRVEAAAALLDDNHGVISGSAPMQIRLIDPLGQVRYDLYRATDRGQLRIELPLAANDPGGKWTLQVRELLSNKEASTTFAYLPAAQCGAVAGATQRAVYFGDDRQHIFNLFRSHHDFTIIIGAGDYHSAVDRLIESLRPWGIECKLMKASDVKVHIPTEDALKSWVGLQFGRPDMKRPNAGQLGFDVRGATILLGTPDDNEIIKFAADHGFLPYSTDAGKDPRKPVKKGEYVEHDFPGRGRGYIAWQRDAVSYGNESVTLIGYDDAGISEAIGSFYECVAAIDPLTEFALPAPASVTLASVRTVPGEANVAWRAVVPDRVVTLSTDAGKIAVVTEDGTKTTLDSEGKAVGQPSAGAIVSAEATVPAKAAAEFSKQSVPGRIIKKIAVANGHTALRAIGAERCKFSMPRAPSSRSRFSPTTSKTWFGSRTN